MKKINLRHQSTIKFFFGRHNERATMKPLNASALRATRVCRERYSTPNGLYLLDHYRWVEGCRRPDGRVVAGPPSREFESGRVQIFFRFSETVLTNWLISLKCLQIVLHVLWLPLDSVGCSGTALMRRGAAESGLRSPDCRWIALQKAELSCGRRRHAEEAPPA